MENSNIELSKYYLDIYKLIDNNIKHFILTTFLCVFILIGDLDKGEFKTIYLIIVFECIAIILSKLAIFYFDTNSFNKYISILNSAIILGVHLCVGLCVLGVYIAQLSF